MVDIQFESCSLMSKTEDPVQLLTYLVALLAFSHFYRLFFWRERGSYEMAKKRALHACSLHKSKNISPDEYSNVQKMLCIITELLSYPNQWFH